MLSNCRADIGFQSTPPVKAATVIAGIAIGAKEFQSTPPVKAATQFGDPILQQLTISIHAAREGGD